MKTTTTLRPADLAEVRDAVRDTPGRLAVAGAGTAAGWAGDLDTVDAVLDLSALSGVITHNPGDMTVSAHAGTPLRALTDELAEHGQHVSLDAARIADGATLGGLVATGDSGPSSLVYGTMRDLVIGVTVVLADGTVARSGGHVIKNVAGYDLAKLLHGSHGTLGVLTEIVLRLHPVPQRAATLVVDAPLARAAELAARVLEGPYEPVALEWISHGSGQLLVRIEGTDEALPARVQRLQEVLDGGDEAADDPWLRHAELTRGSPEAAVLRIGARPSVLPALVADVAADAATVGLGTGVATVSLPPHAVAEAHGRVHAAGGTSQLRYRPPGADAPAWGPPPSALAVLRAVKTELDPDGRFGPGRFSPWM
ncbi:FAD-binding oxidoreductase [Pseudonocardia abyssalis]|uniref:FAD-binding protein n=1 Tax=Pseudonocardia abyssalis TaxID=2792008 RepID=A0ABS6UK87_9PSEU|nr:FAD-binding protein [Pseudonocardia abyssalis]MBW0117250.1 FAD-binding protein [Pseudonocardia abyssalis]MBW0132680.1 FAD-binding protein [Pseudonocardia abyssalis]